MSGQLQLVPATPPSVRFTSLRLDEIVGWEHARPRPALIAHMRRVQAVWEPIVVMPTRQGKHRFGEGRRRVKAVAILDGEGEWPKPVRVPAVIISGPDTSRRAIRAAAALAMHATRGESPASELQAIETILDAAGADQEAVTVKQIAAETGMPEQTIRRRLRLRNLIPPLRRAFDHGEITAGVAEAAARLSSTLQEDLARLLAAGERITTAVVRELTRTQTRAAADALPGGLFAERELSWQVTVAGHLEAAVRVLPDGEDAELARDLAGLLERVRGGLATPVPSCAR